MRFARFSLLLKCKTLPRTQPPSPFVGRGDKNVHSTTIMQKPSGRRWRGAKNRRNGLRKARKFNKNVAPARPHQVRLQNSCTMTFAITAISLLPPSVPEEYRHNKNCQRFLINYIRIKTLNRVHRSGSM